MIITFLFKIVSLILSIIGLQSLVRCVLAEINDKIEISMEKIKENAPESEEKLDITELNRNEIVPFKLISMKKKDLGFLTKIIGYLEIFIFIVLTFILIFNYGFFTLSTLKILSITASTWIGLKIFGNYQQWSGPVFGRALFYSFLIVSLINISGGIILGYLTYFLFNFI